MGSLWETLPTEAIHPESEHLDQRPPREILALLAREDRRMVEAVRAEGPRIEKAASMLERALSRGGRVFFAGAGTSGRLGVLEAAECPPTFGTDPDRIIALVAGGRDAVFQAVEGAEDREAEGRKILASRRLGSKDL
ncbi:MAG: N-acetylmuramic acid 6-phosphate etherase, partial [Vicinamibacteria bacterium]